MGTGGGICRLGEGSKALRKGRGTYSMGHLQEHRSALFFEHAIGQCNVARNVGMIHMGIEGLSRCKAS